MILRLCCFTQILYICDISNICALCIGYKNIKCAFNGLSFSSVFISKFCVILSKHFRGSLKSRYFLSRKNKSLAKRNCFTVFRVGYEEFSETSLPGDKKHKL